MKRLPACILVLLLTGCSQTTMPRAVYMPVPVTCPVPHIPPKPILATASLQPDAKPDVVIKAYAADLKALTSYSDELRKILMGYSA